MFDQTLFDRLMANSYVHPTTGCRIWQGQTDGDKDDPYGRTTYKGQTIAAHRAMWKACKGKFRKGYDIDHGCTTRLCINFDHLKEVTKLKNQRLKHKRKKHKGDVFRCLAVK